MKPNRESHSSAGPSPRVSIFIPVYNGESFLSRTVDSILAQTFRDFEVVIVDDGSTDGTHTIAGRYADRDPRVKVVAHPANRGVAEARNTGFRASSPSAAYVMNHDSDDISLPGKLARLVRYLDTHPTVDASGCFADYVDMAGAPLGWPLIEWRPGLIWLTGAERNSVLISTTLARRKLFEQTFPFRREYGVCDDYDFWSRALRKGFRLANIPEVLHLICIHPGSIGWTWKDEMAALSGRIQREFAEETRQGVLLHLAGKALSRTLNLRTRLRRAATRYLRGGR